MEEEKHFSSSLGLDLETDNFLARGVMTKRCGNVVDGCGEYSANDDDDDKAGTKLQDKNSENKELINVDQSDGKFVKIKVEVEVDTCDDIESNYLNSKRLLVPTDPVELEDKSPAPSNAGRRMIHLDRDHREGDNIFSGSSSRTTSAIKNNRTRDNQVEIEYRPGMDPIVTDSNRETFSTFTPIQMNRTSLKTGHDDLSEEQMIQHVIGTETITQGRSTTVTSDNAGNTMHKEERIKWSCSEYGDAIRHEVHTDQHTSEDNVSDSTLVIQTINNPSLCMIRKLTGDKPYQCTVCLKCFTQKGNLVVHLRQHAEDKPHKCTVCDKTFTHSAELSRHMRRHVEEKTFVCGVCNISFLESSDLTRHMQVHTGERPFQCSVCSKTFTRKTLLTRHVRLHTGEKPYPCTQCDTSFSRKDLLTTHLRQHAEDGAGEKPPSLCSFCGMSFTDKAEFTRHVAGHKRRKTYICGICDRIFPQRFELTCHMRRHSGEKPFKCTVCTKSFTQNNFLTRHMRFHLGDRPYHCMVCYKKFTQSSDLNRHMKLHEGEEGSSFGDLLVAAEKEKSSIV